MAKAFVGDLPALPVYCINRKEVQDHIPVKLNPNVCDFIPLADNYQRSRDVNPNSNLASLNPKAIIFLPPQTELINEHLDKTSLCISHKEITYSHDRCQFPIEANFYNILTSNLDPNAEIFVPYRDSAPISPLNVNTTQIVDVESPCQPYNLPTVSQSDATSRDIEINSYTSINDLRCKNMKNIIFGLLNVNSIRNKFDILKDMISGKIDILFLTETKIDDSFPTAQFIIPGFSVPYRLDRKNNGNNGGGIILYVRDDIPSKIAICPQATNGIECLFIEVSFYKTKWLIGGSYNPSKTMIAGHVETLGKYLNYFYAHYDNILLMGDFNSEPQEHHMVEFCAQYNLKNIVQKPTCYKNIENPSCIDLILTNRNKSFHRTTTIETGISDFHKLVLTVLKSHFKKSPPNVVTYREYKNYIPQIFRLELDYIFPCHTLFTMSNDKFIETFMEVLNRHAPLRYKYVRMNQGPFMTKILRKEIMKRSRLRNTFIADNSQFNKVAYNRQRNKCTSLIRKAKNTFYSTLHPDRVSDSKTFWRTVKPLFSEKGVSSQNIILIDDDDTIVKEDSEVLK